MTEIVDIHLRALRRLTEKKARYVSLHKFLTECKRNKVIPKGFQIKWRLNLGSNRQNKVKIHRILDKSSEMIIDETIEICQNELEDIENRISQEKQKVLKKNVNERYYEEEIEKEYESQLHKLRQSKKKQIQSLRGRNRYARSKDQSLRVQEPQVEISQVRGDGNCFYRCVSLHLYGTDENHKEIRADIAKEIQTDPSFFKRYVDIDIDKHVENTRRSDGSIESYATEAELIACSKLFDIDIHVTSDIDNPVWHRYSVNDVCSHSNCLLLHYQSNHFNYLRSQKCPCSRHREMPTSETETEIKDQTYHDNDSATLPSNDEDEATNKNSKGKTPTIYQNKEIYNLSKRKLNKHERNLLSKGLKYVPTCRNIDINKLLTELKVWERRMRLKEYFYERENDRDNSETQETDKMKKQNANRQWTPAEGRNRWLDQYVTEVKNDIIKGLKRDFKMNVTKGEENALKSLMNDNSIIIRPADKGSGIVIIDADSYKTDIEKELLSNGTYEQIPETTVQKLDRKLKKTVNDMYKNGVITSDMKKYLLPSGDARKGRVQANPKLHKTGNPNRIIINGRHTKTENIAAFVEEELSSHVTKLPSYIQDTTDFLNKLEHISQPLPEDTIMFCLDVRALYPSIPRHEARLAAERALNERKSKSVPTKDILDLMDIVLDSNIFTFNDETYVEKIGTAIGSKLGMTYACTYMGEWEKELFSKSEKLPSSYYRYIDDIWGIWTHGEDTLKEFVKTANNIHPNIQLELRYSTENIEFLDVKITTEKGYLKTDLYTKDTDGHLYLHKSSNHPRKTKDAIPYGLGLRLRRICSSESDYKKRRNELKQQLARRGYKNHELEGQLTKTDKLDRRNLLKYKSKKKNVPLVITYSD
ncbi:hypothetical protein FSP39_003763 [Pinctada imbricata]|uniref:OTU domain-containing protein n=1 Tax=Pinctada imbricata TaxID=66713 RepID=A0AA89C315_PINIB|nr:hypothetical protein FSP39_003763 [Pinctada imbricata]